MSAALLLLPFIPLLTVGVLVWWLGDGEWWRAAIRLAQHRRLSASMCRCPRCDCDRWRIQQQERERQRGLRR